MALLLAGVSLMLGLFTQTGTSLALALLALFYISSVPTRGVYEPGAEGSYLYVNKNLVEAAAVFVLLVFRTGRIAGLDLIIGRRRRGSPASSPDAGRHGEGTLQLDPTELEPDAPQEALK